MEDAASIQQETTLAADAANRVSNEFILPEVQQNGMISYPFQTEASDELTGMLIDALNSSEKRTKSNNIICEAPVGSGKTKILFDAMVNTAKEFDDVAFLFITLSKGSLDEQTLASFRTYPKGDSDLEFLTVDDLIVSNGGGLASEGIPHHTCTVVGWDAINSKTNIQMREAETETFRSIVEKNAETRFSRLVCIIDEAHANLGSNKSQNVLHMAKPYAVVLSTATVRESSDFMSSNRVCVSVGDVAACGKIRNTVSINDGGIGDGGLAGITDDDLLRAAIARQSSLESRYASVGMDVVPLAVVQVPNDTGGKDSDLRNADIIHDRLVSFGVDEDDIGIWVDKKQTIEPLSVKYSTHRFLVVKLAIATGWDCPRAQILVKFRPKSKSDTLDMQTLGRVYRTTDPGEWIRNEAYRNCEELNTVYIYTNNDDMDAELASLHIKGKQNIATMRPTFADSAREVRVISYYAHTQSMLTRDQIRTMKRDISDMMNRFVPSNYRDGFGVWKFHEEGMTRRLVSGKRQTDLLVDATRESAVSFDTIDVTLDREDAEDYVDSLIRRTAPIAKYATTIENGVADHIREHIVGDCRTLAERSEAESVFADVYLMIAEHFNEFAGECQKIIKRQIRVVSDTVNDGRDAEHPMWTPPTTVFCGSKMKRIGETSSSKYLYDQQPKFQSAPEKRFVSDVLETKDCEWYTKNGTHKTIDMSLTYTTKNGSRHDMFPDFVAKFGSVLLIAEVKASFGAGVDNAIDMDRDAEKALGVTAYTRSSYPAASIEAMKEAGSDIEEIVVGIVRRDDTTGKWNIYTEGTEDTYRNVNSADWKPLNDVLHLQSSRK